MSIIKVENIRSFLITHLSMIHITKGINIKPINKKKIIIIYQFCVKIIYEIIKDDWHTFIAIPYQNYIELI